MNYPHLRLLSLFVTPAILSSCASMPDVEMSYYLPKSEVNIVVTQTIMCKDLANPIVQTAVKFTPVYSADRGNPQSVDFDILDTWYSRGDATVTLTADGRLSAFNSTSTGSGAEIVDTIIEVASGLKSAGPKAKDIEKACKEVNRLAGSTKAKPSPLFTVILSSVIIFDKDADKKVVNNPFTLENYPKGTYEDIVKALGPLSFNYEENKSLKDPVTDDSSKQAITVVEPASIKLNVVWSATNSATSTYSSSVLVPQLGFEYKLPIPDPPFFGSSELELTLHPSGKIQKLKYGTKDGVQNASAAFSKASGQFKDEDATNAEKAAELKAQSDVIFQQQRLILCESDPKLCTK